MELDRTDMTVLSVNLGHGWGATLCKTNIFYSTNILFMCREHLFSKAVVPILKRYVHNDACLNIFLCFIFVFWCMDMDYQGRLVESCGEISRPQTPKSSTGKIFIRIPLDLFLQRLFCLLLQDES